MAIFCRKKIQINIVWYLNCSTFHFYFILCLLFTTCRHGQFQTIQQSLDPGPAKWYGYPRRIPCPSHCLQVAEQKCQRGLKGIQKSRSNMLKTLCRKQRRNEPGTLSCPDRMWTCDAGDHRSQPKLTGPENKLNFEFSVAEPVRFRSAPGPSSWWSWSRQSGSGYSQPINHFQSYNRPFETFPHIFKRQSR